MHLSQSMQNLGHYEVHIRSTFDLVVFNVILGSFSVLVLVSKWPAIQKGSS